MIAFVNMDALKFDPTSSKTDTTASLPTNTATTPILSECVDPIPVKTNTTTSLSDLLFPSAPRLECKTQAVVNQFESNFDDGDLVLNFAIFNKNPEITKSSEYIKNTYPSLV